MVEWRPCQVEGWEVSEFGVVRKIGDKKLLTPHRHKDGYIVYTTHRQGKHVHLYAHQAVAYAWYGPCPEGHECHHRNDKRNDNRPGNIVYRTKEDNLSGRQWPSKWVA